MQGLVTELRDIIHRKQCLSGDNRLVWQPMTNVDNHVMIDEAMLEDQGQLDRRPMNTNLAELH